jgi:hypothetical protein
MQALDHQQQVDERQWPSMVRATTMSNLPIASTLPKCLINRHVARSESLERNKCG